MGYYCNNEFQTLLAHKIGIISLSMSIARIVCHASFLKDVVGPQKGFILYVLVSQRLNVNNKNIIMRDG